MRKYKLKCSKYLVSDYFNEGKEMYKTKSPNIFYKKEDDGIIYQFEYDKDENVINKKEWLNISQEDFLNEKWSVVYYIDENTISSEYSDIFNAYDKYCEENNISKLEKQRIHEYLCFVLMHKATFIVSKQFKDDISENININYFVKILCDIEGDDDFLFSIDYETCCICFYDQFYKSFKQNDNFDQVIEDNREFVKFLCEYKLSNIKQN